MVRVPLCLLLLVLAGCQRPAPGRVVLVGGPAIEAAGRHAYPQGIARLQALIEASPDARSAGLVVEAHPDGWPSDPAAFDGASTVVWYFDGLGRHPLLDPERRARFEALMKRGVGLVVLHQASTTPADDDLGLRQWLGMHRAGMADRTTETAGLRPAPAAHPVTRGVQPFTYRDEFYPTFHPLPGRPAVTPILQATLHVQYRDGAPVREHRPEDTTVAWAFERRDGGRAFGFSGAHYLASLDEPMVRTLLLNAILWSAGLDVPAAGVRSGLPDAAPPVGAPATADAPMHADVPTFQRDPQRTGWYPNQPALTPAAVSGRSFGLLWESPVLDAHDGQPARLYASPLYVDRVRFVRGPHAGLVLPVVFAASSNGFVYAINAARHGDLAAGRILWRRQLAPPCRLQPAALDGVPTGVLSTPVIDRERGRLYVTSCDPQHRWRAYALDLASGDLVPGWPVTLDEPSLNAINRNAGPAPTPPTRKFDFRVQRGALNLSPDGRRLYVVFGETETGWLVSVDTEHARLHSAFAAVAMPHRGSGGIWGAGGPAVDVDGHVYVATGSGYNGFIERDGDWTQSVLKLDDRGDHGLRLRGTYTPFNYCQSATMDIDLGSGGAMLVPELAAGSTTTPRLMVVGGKQGNAYLLDRDALPGRLDRRQPCSRDAASDGSLLSPHAQPQFGGRGPLNVFGPYSEDDAAMDQARARSVPAYFRDADGHTHVLMTGNTRQAQGSSVAVAPSLVRLRVAATPGRPAYLQVERTASAPVFLNPGSPVLTSDGSRHPIVWVLDENAGRSALLAGDEAPSPVLHALDAMTLAPLWRSAPGELATSGKYNAPIFARGQAIVGTDRIQAFGAGRTIRSAARSAPATRTATAAVATPAIVTVQGAADTAALYVARCAMCHDQPQGNIPARALLATRSHERIVHALTHGVMRAQAAGLRANEIDALSRYLRQ